MIVTVPQQEDKQLIFSLYNTATDLDSRSIDYFFSEHYDPAHFLIVKQADVVLCCMKVREESIFLKGYHVEVMLIEQLVVSGNCPRSVKNEFIDACLAQFEKRKLFTVLTDSLIKNRSFENIFRHKRYKLQRPALFNVDGYSISDRFEAHELLSAYDSFAKHFDSFMHKDLAYFEEKIKRLRNDNVEIFVSRDAHHDIVGYIVYNYIDGELEVLTVIYKDTLALLTLLNQAMGMNSHIYVNVSLNENLQKIFGSIHYDIIEDVFIRVNDVELFQRLYRTKCNSLTEFLDKNQRPLYLGFY